MKTRSELLTSHLKRLADHAKVLKLVLVQRRSKVTPNETVNIIHEQVNGFGSSGITDFLPNNTQVATNNVTKLGAMLSTCRQMKSIIVHCIEKLINNAKERFFV